MAKVTTNTLSAGTFNTDEAGMFLPLAAKAAMEGKATVDQGKAKGATALAVMIAGFASDEVSSRAWSFDIKGGDDATHTHVDCIGWTEFGDDDLSWKRNGQGAVSKIAQTAYKTGLQVEFFGLPNSVPAVWTMASKAIPIAKAIRAEGMTALLVDGELKLSGGNGDRAKAMAEAKSLAGLAKVAKGETGSNRDGGHGAGKGGEAGEARVATPEEILSAALRLVEGVKKGEVALTSAALSYARRIAVLVAADNGADFDD